MDRHIMILHIGSRNIDSDGMDMCAWEGDKPARELRGCCERANVQQQLDSRLSLNGSLRFTLSVRSQRNVS